MIRTKGPAHEAALQLAELNLFSFPCLGKAPVVANWTEGRPSRPLVDSYFRNRPDANLGLRTGNGLFAIDLDAKHDGEAVWADFLRKRKLLLTATALTPGGGRHLLFGAPARCVIRNSTGWRGMPGVDVRGHHGYIVVEPSIIVVGQEEERRERQYVWLRTPQQGIAKAPSWLLEALVEPPATKTSPLGPVQSGDVARLAADLIERFPISGPGQRGGVFGRVVPSVIYRKFDDETCVGAVWGWWAHHYEAGLCRSQPNRDEIAVFVANCRANPRGGVFVQSQADHLAACRRILLPEGVRQAIDGSSQAPIVSSCILDTKGVTQTPPAPLCRTPHEEAFVEALVVGAAHEIESGHVDVVRLTNDQIRAIASDRHSGVEWKPPQMERLKAKFIDRPDKPASRAPLLRQVETGCKAMRGQPATVSAYEVLDLAPLLAMCVPKWASPLW